MATFSWTGLDNKGIKQKGELEAANSDEANRIVSAKGLDNVKVSRSISLDFGGKIELRDVVLFTRTFVTMIEAGLPIIQAMDILIDQQVNKKFKASLNTVKSDVESGATLADGLRKHPAAFDDLYCNLVEAGETGGVLDTVLARLATYYEKQEIIVKKVKGAMTYPVITICIAIGAVILMLLKVMPTFENMFAEMGAELPGPTQFVINLSHSLQEVWFRGLMIIIATVVGIKALARNEKAAYVLDLIMLRLPLLGNLVLLGAMARFTQTLGTLLASGVPIIDALDIGRRVVGNRVLAEEIQMAKDGIEQGKTFTEPLADAKFFPKMALQMIEVGETTGQLDAMLEKVSKYFEEEVDGAVESLTAAIEPIIMVFVAVAVGGMLIAMYMPIFTIASAVH